MAYAGNTYRIQYEYKKTGQAANIPVTKGAALIAASSIKKAADLALSSSGQDLFNPKLPPDIDPSTFDMISISRQESASAAVTVNGTDVT